MLVMLTKESLVNITSQSSKPSRQWIYYWINIPKNVLDAIQMENPARYHSLEITFHFIKQFL